MRIYLQDDMPKTTPEEEATSRYIIRQAALRPQQPRTELEKQILAEMTHRPKPPARPDPPIQWTDIKRWLKKFAVGRTSHQSRED